MKKNLNSIQVQPSSEEKRYKVLPLILHLSSRMVLFLLFQGLMALILGSWGRSEGYWLLTATLTNLVSISFLVFLLRRENESFIKLFRFSGDNLKKDILIFAGLTLLCGPVVFGPNWLLSNWLWDDPEIAVEIGRASCRERV